MRSLPTTRSAATGLPPHLHVTTRQSNGPCSALRPGQESRTAGTTTTRSATWWRRGWPGPRPGYRPNGCCPRPELLAMAARPATSGAWWPGLNGLAGQPTTGGVARGFGRPVRCWSSTGAPRPACTSSVPSWPFPVGVLCVLPADEKATTTFEMLARCFEALRAGCPRWYWPTGWAA